MKKTIGFGILVLLIITGCNDENNTTPNSGEATITSELILEGSTYTFNGFSFGQGKVIFYNPASGNMAPDLVVIPDNSGPEIIAILQILNNVQEKQLMSLVAEFEDFSSAENFFNSYSEISDTLSYRVWAKPTLENQIWIIKTLSSNFAKILIKDVLTYLDGTKPYAEVTFKWVYQPDGSMIFN